MKNRSKMIAATLVVALGCTLLSGCGSSASSTASSSEAASSSVPASSSLSAAPSVNLGEGTNGNDELAETVNTLLDTDPISNQFEITAMNIEYDFGLKAEDVASYKGVKSNDNGDAGLVLVIEPAEGKMQDVIDALNTYREDQVAFYGNYSEFAQAQDNMENAVIVGNDELVVMLVASNECSADLTKAADSLLNG